MQGKILGIPLVLLVLVVLIVAPLAVADFKLSQQMNKVLAVCSTKAVSVTEAPTPTPTVVPTVSPVIRRLVPATSSAR